MTSRSAAPATRKTPFDRDDTTDSAAQRDVRLNDLLEEDCTAIDVSIIHPWYYFRERHRRGTWAIHNGHGRLLRGSRGRPQAWPG